MLKRILFLLTGLAALKSQGQYRISGQIDSVFGKTVYLSYVEDYRKLSRIYMGRIAPNLYWKGKNLLSLRAPLNLWGHRPSLNRKGNRAIGFPILCPILKGWWMKSHF